MKKLFFIIFFFLFSFSFSYAGNVDTFGVGSKATALGGAFSAYADDLSAIYYNPAGLSQLEGDMATVGFTIMDPNLEVKNFETESGSYASKSSIKDKSDNLTVPFVGYGGPIKDNDKFSFGVAVYVPWGLHIKWEDNPNNNPLGYSSYESYFLREVITPSISYKVNNKLSLGLGVSVGKTESGASKYSSKLAYKLGCSNAKVEAEMEDDVNYSYNLGALYKHSDKLSFGFTYRSRTKAEMDGEYDVYVNGVKSDTYSGDVSLDLYHPEQYQFGIKYDLHPRFSLEFDIVRTLWSVNSEQIEKFEGGALDGSSIVYDRDWNDTTQLRIGLEWEFNEMWTFRGGYFYDPSPIPDDTFDIMWPDADKKTYSLGFGLNLKNFIIDGSVQYSLTEKDRILGGESDNFNDSYLGGGDASFNAGGTIWGYGLTVSYLF